MSKLRSVADFVVNRTLGLDSFLLSGQRKEEINDLAYQVRDTYGVPPATMEGLMELASDESIAVYFSDLAVFAPFSNIDGMYVILPNVEVESHLAHELGHILLETELESEADYFMSAVTGKSVLRNNVEALAVSAHYSLKTLHDYFIYPHFLERDAHHLMEEGVCGGVVNLLKEEIKKTLRI